ncbi:MAG: SEC-C metal-binding domain-containing protein [Bacteroidales bacterium]|nr:SEC-C metal-binding domain-containing protein [Clostridium sp.]MCM1203943.1 SEC-C metal-binding domain-containing protein [Bacteroidales bacterium]
MSLLKEWRDYAYGQVDDRTPEGKQFWLNYFGVEQGIYKQLLSNPTEIVKGTVRELADKYDTTLQIMTGFLDGIDESLRTPNNIDEMDENTEVTLDIDLEKLYMNMVGCNAEWLYTLEEWDKLITPERRKELYRIEKTSKTVVKPPKVGRNDPCPCGSGRKYKQCCGKN